MIDSTTILRQAEHDLLDTEAKRRNKRCVRWVGLRGGGTRKRVVCHVCGREFATYAAKWGMPKHVILAIDAHREQHLDELYEAAR